MANGQLISQTRNTVTHFYLQDGQHSVRALADTAGTVTDTYDYTAFGEIYAQTGTTENPYRFAGQQFDTETDLYSTRARYYDPADGRFLTRDTYAYNYQNPIELNRYVYAANNPINGYDPSGQFVEFAGLNFKTVVQRAAVGGFGGAAFGMFAYVLFMLQLTSGECDYRLEMLGGKLTPELSARLLAAFVGIGTAVGAGAGVLGYGATALAEAGVVSASFPMLAGQITGIGFALLGMLTSGLDAYEHGWNICNAMDFAGAAGGGLLTAGGFPE